MSKKAADWVGDNLNRIAKIEGAKIPKNKRRRIGYNEQEQRFLSGAELGRVQRGEITPTQFQKYREHWLKRLGVEV